MYLFKRLFTFYLIWNICFTYTEASSFIKINKNDIEDLEDLLIELPEYGKLLGKNNNNYYSYEAIPYAKPPIGDLRFEAPQPYTEKWSDIFDATQIPAKCIQYDQFERDNDHLAGVEDCLQLSIYKTKTKSVQKLPVIVTIHGGAFMFGGVHIYNHEYLMQSGDVIVVKLSYRLGPLGFLSTEDNIISGNFGLKDQRLALQWIKRNIVYFGGDPEQILVIGFSAGAASVHLQLLSPEFANITKAAASFSGNALNPWVIIKESRKNAFALGAHLNCTNLNSNSINLKKCLKEKSAEDIVRNVKKFLIHKYNPFTTFGPVVEAANTENAFLTKTPEEILRVGNYAQVPWLVTYATEDGGYNAAELMEKNSNGIELIEILNERWYELAPHRLFYANSQIDQTQFDEYSRKLKHDYLGEKNFSAATYFQFQQMHTDILFKNQTENSIRLHQKHANSAPVYAYAYDNPADCGIAAVLSSRTDFKFGTNHADDFSLIFDYPTRFGKVRSDEKIISRNFIKMLKDFIKNGHDFNYDKCKFINNIGQDQLQLMYITKDNCENKVLDHFP